jgi:hypothetical protein
MTGYTHEVAEKGMTLENFILSCARAFGACVTLRYDNIDKAPRVIKKDDYYEKQLIEVKKELEKWNKLTKTQQTKQVERERKESIASDVKCHKKNVIENERLMDMRNKVENWFPPTKNHYNLKKFMLEQIDMSLHDLSYYLESIKRQESITTSELIKNKELYLSKDIEYYKKFAKESDETNNERNEWLEQLYKSLNM